ncbi:DNA ligase [Mesorhizobium sp. M1393]|uniref:ATP-dependent DNA ligase n=1 Tax=unclassified Mesorhizobium TaxID=325217 RepID=UPI00333D225F
MRKIVSTGARRLEFIPPMEPKLVAKPPGGEDWIHEIKLDGYRSQIVINSPEDIRVYTKTGADWTSKYTGLVEAARELEVENAITNSAGLPDFGALQTAVHSDPYAMVLGAFDILHLNGHDLRDIGCKGRHEILYGIIKPNSRIQFSEAIPGDLVTQRRSSISPTRPGSKASSRSVPTASIAAARRRTG